MYRSLWIICRVNTRTELHAELRITRNNTRFINLLVWVNEEQLSWALRSVDVAGPVCSTMYMHTIFWRPLDYRVYHIPYVDHMRKLVDLWERRLQIPCGLLKQPVCVASPSLHPDSCAILDGQAARTRSQERLLWRLLPLAPLTEVLWTIISPTFLPLDIDAIRSASKDTIGPGEISPI